ncbi:MAG: S46 family peptidase [Elusimicrobia bacterium]|nr:S46 family peptidase [Elusimicrobiota bacterium]
MRNSAKASLFAASIALAAPLGALADEGMWTFDNPPSALLKERYGFTPTPQWLEHLRLSSVRLNDGGSGSFVSSEGLVLTNHHVALGQLQKVSSEKKDYVQDGFYATTRGEELPCPDMEMNVLVSMEEVTDRVLGALDPKAPDRAQNEQRKAEMARIEKESADKTGLRSDAVELYYGGEYWLYRYKKYTDLRLVFAPEAQAAFYGGDPDNFTYPRYDLDMALFRAYEDGKPARPKHWLKWSKAGAKEGDLVFVSGHPGHTERLQTLAQLEFQRDRFLPMRLKLLRERLKALRAYSARGAEQARRAQALIYGYENSNKALTGSLEGLLSPRLLSDKAKAESEFRSLLASKPETADCAGAFDRIAAAEKLLAPRSGEHIFRSRPSGSRLLSLAESIVRWAREAGKPNEKRYEEFRDSALESLRFETFSPAPLYADLEETMLGLYLRMALQEFGPEHPFVKAALGGGKPEDVASQAVAGTKLFDPEFRRRLVEGGLKAVESAEDPLVALARRMDPDYREMRKWYEDNIQSVLAVEGRRIAKARFAAFGRSTYPDATFTLRLSFGKVAGYEEGTTLVPSRTTFFGLFDRAESFEGMPPFDLPRRFAEARGRLDLATPLNFATTNDIIGGNSGSPVADKDGRLVGLIFDGNIQGLILDYVYTEEQSRAVAVHSAGMLHALAAVYGMDALADELAGAKP